MATASDRVIDEMVKICRDVKEPTWPAQVKALWKVFNIMAGFIKGQANLIAVMDGKIKQQQIELDRLKKTVASILPEKKTPVN